MNKDLLEKANKTELTSTEKMIENSIPEIAKMMGEDAAKRFARIITTDIRLNPELSNCDPLSLMGAIFTSAELNLEPIAGRAYILPFKDYKKGIVEAKFILGYSGIVDLFYRHANSLALSWNVVHANDEFEYEDGSNAFVKHKRALGDRGEKIAYWVGAHVNDKFVFEVMTYEECIAHGKQHSKTYNKKEGKFYFSSPWVKSEDSMCKKTVLIQLSKTLPLSVELQQALHADESSRSIHPNDFKEGKILKALEAPDETNWKEEVERELERDNK